ncbi:hypothetical protein C4K38_3737 [Pseudomonas chlororaphis subsp. piscium]|nr:hypothetical protein C4K38_3737 [Pseudomonas chlororaphis subsp. piscium]
MSHHDHPPELRPTATSYDAITPPMGTYFKVVMAGRLAMIDGLFGVPELGVPQ